MEKMVGILIIKNYQVEELIDTLLNNGYIVKLQKENETSKRIQIYSFVENKESEEK